MKFAEYFVRDYVNERAKWSSKCDRSKSAFTKNYSADKKATTNDRLLL